MALKLDPARTVIGVNRFGLGVRGNTADVDLKAWLKDPRGALKSDLVAERVTLPANGLLDTPTALTQLAEEQEMRKAERTAVPAQKPTSGKVKTAPTANGMLGDNMAEAMPKFHRRVYEDEAAARLGKAYAEPLGFAERLVWFWSNHFAVSVAKSQPVMVTAGSFEREAIRPHVLGRFTDMLQAVEHHPTMLSYLDNRNSIGPNSRAGQRQKKGLNENLAREILELHTLGVGNGYTQADVTSLAKMITGWSFANPRQAKAVPGTFVFNKNTHEPGGQTLLGKAYAEGGVEQGEAALGDLARHDATAKHIAFKLARHFVADVPPPELVAALARVFLKTDGDLKAVATALVDADVAWATPRNKMRSPAEFVLAASRALGVEPAKPKQLLRVMEQLGQPLWGPPGPNGFGDGNDTWASSEGLKLRLDLSVILARQCKLELEPVELLQSLCGGAASADTQQAVQRAESQKQGLALMLMSTELQRR